ncbi:MAG: transglycosylase SLT domain-containing protein [Myxococcota bacterium]
MHSALMWVRALGPAVLAVLVACGPDGDGLDPLGVCEDPGPDVSVCEGDPYDLDHILETRVLRVAMSTDPTSWFLDGTRVRGFEYEVLAGFARSKGLELQLTPEPDVRRRLEGLRAGRYDVVAGRLAVLPVPGVDYVPLTETHRVVLQTVEEVHSGRAVEDVEGLEGHVVRVVDQSGNRAAVEDLGLTVDLRVYPDGTLLETLVADLLDEGGAVVARADLAAPLAEQHNLVIGPALPGVAGAHLAVRDGAVGLSNALSNWVVANERVVVSAQAKYLDARATVRKPGVSAYDDLFRVHADRIDWDWTLLAAQAWRESKFKPQATSHAGAQGLMQIMPATAGELGVENPSDPAQSVRGAADYLRRLDRYYEKSVAEPEKRLPFVLAAYNAGMGHVDDARRLAEVNGDDPNDWDGVAPWMLALSDREWNRHPVVRNGYCRGTEPVAYVESILNRRAVYDALLSPPGL